MTPEEQYKVCDKRFSNIDDKLDKIYNKLFEDNGTPCLQTKVDRNTRWISGVTWALCGMYLAFLSVVAWMFKK